MSEGAKQFIENNALEAPVGVSVVESSLEHPILTEREVRAHKADVFMAGEIHTLDPQAIARELMSEAV